MIKFHFNFRLFPLSYECPDRPYFFYWLLRIFFQRRADKCSECKEPIIGTVYTLDGKNFCEEHYMGKSEGCPKCGEKITGHMVRTNSAAFHSSKLILISSFYYRDSPVSVVFWFPANRTIGKTALNGDWFSTKIAIWDFQIFKVPFFAHFSRNFNFLKTKKWF